MTNKSDRFMGPKQLRAWIGGGCSQQASNSNEPDVGAFQNFYDQQSITELPLQKKKQPHTKLLPVPSFHSPFLSLSLWPRLITAQSHSWTAYSCTRWCNQTGIHHDYPCEIWKFPNTSSILVVLITWQKEFALDPLSECEGRSQCEHKSIRCELIRTSLSVKTAYVGVKP